MAGLNKFSLNYDLEIKEGYQTFIFEALTEENFTNNDFAVAIKTIMRDNNTTYGKMPNIAMFIEARPPKQYKSTRPENQVLIADRKPLEIENKLTPEQQEALNKKIAKGLQKLKVSCYLDKRRAREQKKYWNSFLKDNPVKDNPIQGGIRSPQLQKLVKNNTT